MAFEGNALAVVAGLFDRFGRYESVAISPVSHSVP